MSTDRNWKLVTIEEAEARIFELETFHARRPPYDFCELAIETLHLARLRFDRDAIPLTEMQQMRIDVLEVILDEWRAADAFRRGVAA